MKKLLVIILLFALTCSSAAANVLDLSGLSYDELLQLREQLNLAIWNSREWKEVTVPAGVWQVGVDIPAGHWSIRVATEMNYLFVTYFDSIDSAGLGPNYAGYVFQQQIASEDLVAYGVGCPASVDIDLKDGWFIRFDNSVVFSPYSGHADFGFSW